MTEPLAYLGGQMIPASQAAVPVFDAGFVLGATVTEQLRTFRGEIFRLPEHLQRLERSLELVGIVTNESMADLADIAQRLVLNNSRLIDPADDVGLCIFITPGPYAAMAEGRTYSPLVCLHTYPLPFQLWSSWYTTGGALSTTPVQQIPAECWSSQLKCRSRMHYFLADRSAAQADPGSRALLLDRDGNVMETSTANVVAVFGDRLVSPPRTSVLPGISLQVIAELAGTLGLKFEEQLLTPDELAKADEVLLGSTPNCLLPVVRLNRGPIGAGKPGPIYRRLLSAWNEFVGLDIAEQARRFSNR